VSDDFADRFEEHERMLQGLARLWHRQGEINEELRAFNRQQVAINARLEATQAEISRLLATLVERGANGRGG
jgi:predicted  nucleic acid-binding Zn-ribbon protein